MKKRKENSPPCVQMDELGNHLVCAPFDAIRRRLSRAGLSRFAAILLLFLFSVHANPFLPILSTQVSSGGGSSFPSGAVAHWKLNEASGTRNDSIGSAHLTDNNTVASATGKIGTAADFETDNGEYLSVASSAATQTGDTSFTFAGWFYLESKTSYRMMVSKDSNAGNREYLLYYDGGSDRFTFAVWNAAQTLLQADANALGSPSTATWYFIVAWFDTTDDKVKIQINDGTVNESSASAGFVPLASTEPFRLGTWGSLSLCHDGLMDSVTLWKRTLTTGERTTLYNSGSGLDYP